MALQLRTFSNIAGGNSLFKALGHPAVAPRARRLVEELSKSGRIAVYDPDGAMGEFAQLYSPVPWQVAGTYVQRADQFGTEILGFPAEPITELPHSNADVLFVAAFDVERHLVAIRQLVAPGMLVVTLDDLRLSDAMLSRPRHYLDSLNFATNFAFFRDQDGHHTRLQTANYWNGYGAAHASMWLCLIDEDGVELAQWIEPLPDAASTIVIDSAQVRERFDLPPFTGSLFLHAIGAEAHDVVKYALDLYGDSDEVLSCTHDANAWPAEKYAGLPAPRKNERVLLWIQNSHPAPIPAGSIELRAMGSQTSARFDETIPAFGTRPIDVGSLLPELCWPAQIEIEAGQHFVRPRYEVVRTDGVRWIAHANVERTDLAPDPAIGSLGSAFGKGFILPAPVLPMSDYRTVLLPTPMATTQRELAVGVTVYNAAGEPCVQAPLGRIARSDSLAVEIDSLVGDGRDALGSDYGHFELSYDLSDGGDADGWLHALFRYETRDGSHGADTSFGAHMYNLPVVFGSEPQSYNSTPPGLSTRLFLRLGFGDRQTFCHLIYPASGSWLDTSSTRLMLFDSLGKEVAERTVRIPINGSLLWRYEEMFDTGERAAARNGYVIVRDTTCRLFGFHGLAASSGAFSFDHMFGF
jgi:hypothetical protein